MYKGKQSSTVGTMRYRVTVQAPVKTSDQGQEVVSWVNVLTNEPADYDYVRGYQRANGRQVEEGVDCIFTVRFSPVHQTINRILFEEEEYGIVFVRPISGRRAYLELHAKVIK